MNLDPKEAEMKYCGIDLHSNNNVVLVSDEEDRIVLQKRLPNHLGQIRAALEPHREELAGVVIESTFNWYWLVDGLMDAGYRVLLAHPSAIKKYEGLKYSGDFADAAYLAQLLRLGLLAEGYIYPREERAARDLSRKRMQLVRYRTAQVLSIENILARQTGTRMSSSAIASPHFIGEKLCPLLFRRYSRVSGNRGPVTEGCRFWPLPGRGADYRCDSAGWGRSRLSHRVAYRE